MRSRSRANQRLWFKPKDSWFPNPDEIGKLIFDGYKLTQFGNDIAAPAAVTNTNEARGGGAFILSSDSIGEISAKIPALSTRSGNQPGNRGIGGAATKCGSFTIAVQYEIQPDDVALLKVPSPRSGNSRTTRDAITTSLAKAMGFVPLHSRSESQKQRLRDEAHALRF